MQNICARKFRSATATLLLSEDQCPMMMYIFANHSKYFCKQNLYSFVSEKYLFKPVQKYFCFGNLDPPQLSCCYLRISVQRSIFLQIIQSISYKNYLKYLSNRCKSIFVRKSGSATVILLLSEDQCPPKHLMYTCADNDAVWIFISWPCIPFLLS